jgi:signal transduction histidine kinase
MNAIKFTPDGGAITLSARRADGAVEFRVADTGVGIPEGELPHVFERFFTTFDTIHHSTGSYEFGKRGMGIGLAIVKSFVEMHGGTVGVESSPGEGSTFWFTLPL